MESISSFCFIIRWFGGSPIAMEYKFILLLPSIPLNLLYRLMSDSAFWILFSMSDFCLSSDDDVSSFMNSDLSVDALDLLLLRFRDASLRYWLSFRPGFPW